MLRCWSFDMNTLAPNSASFLAWGNRHRRSSQHLQSRRPTSHQGPAWGIPGIVGSYRCRCVGAAPATLGRIFNYILGRVLSEVRNARFTARYGVIKLAAGAARG
jgi:hypothetical protein